MTQEKPEPSFAVIGEGQVLEKKSLPEGAELYYIENADGTLTCKHCGYTFKPRVDNPKRCSRCQKDLWNWRKLGVPE
jgi:predicted Zn-ribbon and HTH transcriptional regulator